MVPSSPRRDVVDRVADFVEANVDAASSGKTEACLAIGEVGKGPIDANALHDDAGDAPGWHGNEREQREGRRCPRGAHREGSVVLGSFLARARNKIGNGSCRGRSRWPHGILLALGSRSFVRRGAISEELPPAAELSNYTSLLGARGRLLAPSQGELRLGRFAKESPECLF